MGERKGGAYSTTPHRALATMAKKANNAVRLTSLVYDSFPLSGQGCVPGTCVCVWNEFDLTFVLIFFFFSWRTLPRLPTHTISLCSRTRHSEKSRSKHFTKMRFFNQLQTTNRPSSRLQGKPHQQRQRQTDTQREKEARCDSSTSLQVKTPQQ